MEEHYTEKLEEALLPMVLQYCKNGIGIPCYTKFAGTLKKYFEKWEQDGYRPDIFTEEKT